MKAFQNLRQKLGRKVGAMIGGFEGGLSARRLKTFQPSRAHVNTLIQAAGADMTARARYLIRNNGYAANAVESWAGNAVGTGIKPSSGIADAVLKDRVQRLWLRWTDESDAEGLTDFYARVVALDGDDGIHNERRCWRPAPRFAFGDLHRVPSPRPGLQPANIGARRKSHEAGQPRKVETQPGNQPLLPPLQRRPRAH